MKLTVKSGKIENKNEKRCQQTQCTYFTNGGCKSCSTCGAAPYILKKTCSKCIACSSIPNELRWHDPKAIEQMQKIAQQEKDIEQQIAEQAMQIAIGNKPQIIITGPHDINDR